MANEEERAGVRLTNLDQPLFADAGATKRDLVDYLDAVADRFVPALAGRALSVVRVLRGQAPFMQKNLPAYAPASIPTLEVATQDGKRMVRYPVCDDRETLLWFANQRAVEYHPTLFRGHAFDAPTHLIVDLDPPAGSDAFARAVDGRAPGAGGAQRRGHDGAGQDQRRQGRARRRAAGAGSAGGGRRGRHPSRRGPRGAARPEADDHGLRRRGARRQGLPRCDAGRWGDRRGGLQSAGAGRCPGVVPAAVGRPRATRHRPTSPSSPSRGCSVTPTRGPR